MVRFVSWQASHDSREVALTLEQQKALIDRLARNGRVLVSSEAPLPRELEGHRMQGPVEDIHHLLAFARVVVGESSTMASEAAVLGTPAVFIAKTGRGYTDDQERRYGLVKNIRPTDFEAALVAVDEAVAVDSESRRRRRARLLEDKIDLTSWMVDFFERTYG